MWNVLLLVLPHKTENKITIETFSISKMVQRLKQTFIVRPEQVIAQELLNNKYP